MIHQRGINLIKEFEGLHDGDLTKIGLQPKLCPTGFATIGWGRVVIDPVTGKRLSGRAGLVRATQLYPALTEADADAMLAEDIGIVVKQIDVRVKVPLHPYQQAALASWVYNLGSGNLDRSTLLKVLNAGQYDRIPAEIVRWTKGVNPNTGRQEDLPGLVRRRGAEADLWRMAK